MGTRVEAAFVEAECVKMQDALIREEEEQGREEVCVGVFRCVSARVGVCMCVSGCWVFVCVGPFSQKHPKHTPALHHQTHTITHPHTTTTTTNYRKSGPRSGQRLTRRKSCAKRHDKRPKRKPNARKKKRKKRKRHAWKQSNGNK